MGKIILTGISWGSHKFSLEYPSIKGKIKCFAICTCGYQVEILHFDSWGGSKIQYSVIADDEKCFYWENYYLERFVASNGAKPPFNVIMGKSE